MSEMFTTNDSEVTRYKIMLCKYVFLLGKINSEIMGLVLLGLFTDRNDAFPYPFIYYPFLYLKPKKGTERIDGSLTPRA